MQVVDHCRVPVEKHPRHRFRRFVGQLVRVAVAVDKGVFRPVRRRNARQRRDIGLALEIAVEPFDHLVAPVSVQDRVDEHHRVLADAADHRLLGHREPVGQLKHRLGRARLVGVHAGVEVVDRACRRDEAVGRRLVGHARIGQRSRCGPQPFQLRDAALIGDGQHDDVAPLFGAADRKHAHARRSGRECLAIGVGGRHVYQLARRARNAMQEGSRRRHRA